MFNWMTMIAFLCFLPGLPKRVQRYRSAKDPTDLLELLGTIFLAVAALTVLAEELSAFQ